MSSIHAVIIAELKLGNIERQILFADFVDSAHNAAFQDRAEALNRIGVDRANYVLAFV